jgi:hypothetical protein
MITIFIYHYFLAHGVQYFIHSFVHYKYCPSFISNEHRLHHQTPHKITWYGNPTVQTDIVGIYFIAFVLYTLHIFLCYKKYLVHLLCFVLLAMSFLVFHGLCHYLSKETQEKLPILNLLFFHHYKHHIMKANNFGFGDLFYDYLFGTLDVSPINLNKKTIESFDEKYFVKHETR